MIFSSKTDIIRPQLIFSLIGQKSYVNSAAEELEQILHNKSLKTSISNIEPTILSNNNDNNMPQWRISLKNILDSNYDIIINKIYYVNLDAITDFNRSVRSLSFNTHPYAFIVDPNASSRHESSLNKIYDCSQINQIYPYKASFEEKTEEIETYLELNNLSK